MQTLSGPAHQASRSRSIPRHRAILQPQSHARVVGQRFGIGHAAIQLETDTDWGILRWRPEAGRPEESLSSEFSRLPISGKHSRTAIIRTPASSHCTLG